jgi:hypothetical protein
MTPNDLAPADRSRDEGWFAREGLVWAQAVFWLVAAERLRMAAWSLPPGEAFAVATVGDLATFLAFVAVSGVMVRRLGGETGLGAISVRGRIDLALSVYAKLFALSGAAYLGLGWIAHKLGDQTLAVVASHLARGFDGVAFDQYSHAGRAWSAVIACLALLLVIERGEGRPATFAALAAQLRRRWPSLLSGVAAVAAMAIPLAAIQAGARAGLRAAFASGGPSTPNLVLFMLFVVGFAMVRLTATVAILTLALRRSYRRGD